MIEDKKQMRKRLPALSFTDKIKILERLRDRENAIAACGLRREPPSARKELAKTSADSK